jgi:hypothetical protein
VAPSDDASAAPSGPGPGRAVVLGSVGQKEFRPHGTAAVALYDRSPIVGMSGPAGTGKSRLWLEKLHMLCEKYPGCRALITRKTRESISEAALYTFEEKVVPAGHPILDGARRSHRTHYQYPNGSMVIVCGLDKPQKIMSTEFDIAYIQENTETSKADNEIVLTRLRNGVVPYQQLLFDCNPDRPTHWIYQAAMKGEFPMYPSFHEDNPTLWEEAPPHVQAERAAAHPDDLARRATDEWPCVSPDGRVGVYTPEGRAYLSKLDSMTGVRYKRLRLGLWVAAEGGVYEDEWDLSLHLAPPMPLPPVDWRRVWAVDFGFTAPIVIQSWAIDPDGRMDMYRELYQTHTLVEDAAKEFLASAGWSYSEDCGHVRTRDDADELPEAVVCDTDAEGTATFEKHTGLRCVPAYKGIADGVQAVRARLRITPDGRPRLRYCRGSLLRRDPSLKEQGKPQCTAEEVDGYVWDLRPENGRSAASAVKRAEVPLGVDDHGMDTTRYVVCYVDHVVGPVKAVDVAQAAGAFGSTIVGVPRLHRADRRGREPATGTSSTNRWGIGAGREDGGFRISRGGSSRFVSGEGRSRGS